MHRTRIDTRRTRI
uniref:Uncharacterized protein n=1 Tax=Arundo donax TaxID=35708 RepID=A0A0A9FK86_ARUDO